jgi:hypothetical protein
MIMIARTTAFLVMYFRLVDGRVTTAAGLFTFFFLLTDIITTNIVIIHAAGKDSFAQRTLKGYVMDECGNQQCLVLEYILKGKSAVFTNFKR